MCLCRAITLGSFWFPYLAAEHPQESGEEAGAQCRQAGPGEQRPLLHLLNEILCIPKSLAIIPNGS